MGRNDYQAQRLYAAERELPDLGLELLNLDLAKRYVAEATASPYWRELHRSGEGPRPAVLEGWAVDKNGTLPGHHVHVWSGGTVTARGGYWRQTNRRGWGICLPTTAASRGWALVEQVVIHELAHVVVQRRFPRRDPGHGRLYAAVYLDLTAYWRGPDVADLLASAFTEHRVLFDRTLDHLDVPRPDGVHLIRDHLPVQLQSRVRDSGALGTLHAQRTLGHQARTTPALGAGDHQPTLF